MHHESCFHAGSSTSEFLLERIRKDSSLFSFFLFIFFLLFFFYSLSAPRVGLDIDMGGGGGVKVGI